MCGSPMESRSSSRRYLRYKSATSFRAMGHSSLTYDRASTSCVVTLIWVHAVVWGGAGTCGARWATVSRMKGISTDWSLGLGAPSNESLDSDERYLNLGMRHRFIKQVGTGDFGSSGKP
jgi:hypothetical protein